MKYELIKQIEMDWSKYKWNIESKLDWLVQYWLDVDKLSWYFKEVDEEEVELTIDIKNKEIVFNIFKSKWYWWITYEYLWDWKAEVKFVKWY